jgi:tetratricopeptide (TPR) repeat protein
VFNPEDVMAEGKATVKVDLDQLEADFQADPGNFVSLTRAYLERKLALQAIEACKQGLQSSPGTPDGFLALGMAYYHNYDDRRAVIALKKALKASPDSSVAHRTLGEIFLDRGQEQKAAAELMQSFEIEPRDTHTRALLQAMEESVPQSGNGRLEVYWVPRQSSIAREPPKPFRHTAVQVGIVAVLVAAFLVWYNHYVDIRVQVADHIKTAGRAIPNDNHDDLLLAEKELNAAILLKDSDEKAIVAQANVLSLLWQNHDQQGRLVKLKEYQQWMDAEELPNSERFAVKALLMINDGKAEDAVKFLNKTIKRGMDKQDIFLNAMIFGARARANLMLGNIKEAREDYSRAARFSGDSPRYQAAFADVYLREGNLPRAIRYFKEAKRKNPSHVYSNLRMAYALIQQGKRLKNAKQIIDEFEDRQKHPEGEFSKLLTGMLHLIHAEYELATENVPEADDWLRKSLDIYPNNAEAHGLAGRLAALNQDEAKTNASFARAIQLDPRLPKSYFDRAKSLFLLSKQTEAVNSLKDFERFLKPTVAYHVTKGNLLMRMDDLQAAMNEFQNGVKVDELDPDARFHVARCHQTMADKIPNTKDQKGERLAKYNEARQWYEDTIILPGGERWEVYYQMCNVYLATENSDNALDNCAKAIMMAQRSGESPKKVAGIYGAIAKIFNYLGGSKGEEKEREYLAKQKALLEGKTPEEVEEEWQEKQKKEKKKSKRRRR